jgi:hypothetical protein
MTKSQKNKRAMNDGSIFGLSVEFWDRSALWALVGGLVFGGLALILSTFSAWVSMQTTSAAQKEAAARIAEAQAAGQLAASEAAKANERNTELQIQLEQERTNRIELERKFAWRHLTAKQRVLLQASLTSCNIPVIISTTGTDPESTSFANELLEALSKCGCVANMYFEPQLPAISGISVALTPNEPSALVRGALEKAEIPFGQTIVMGEAPQLFLKLRSD